VDVARMQCQMHSARQVKDAIPIKKTGVCNLVNHHVAKVPSTEALPGCGSGCRW
jgi:hypothetical protein